MPDSPTCHIYTSVFLASPATGCMILGITLKMHASFHSCGLISGYIIRKDMDSVSHCFILKCTQPSASFDILKIGFKNIRVDVG